MLIEKTRASRKVTPTLRTARSLLLVWVICAASWGAVDLLRGVVNSAEVQALPRLRSLGFTAVEGGVFVLWVLATLLVVPAFVVAVVIAVRAKHITARRAFVASTVLVGGAMVSWVLLVARNDGSTGMDPLLGWVSLGGAVHIALAAIVGWLGMCALLGRNVDSASDPT